jgi:hypothetical protein
MLHLEYSLEKQEFQEFVYYANWLSPEQKDHRFKYYFNNIVSYIVMVFIFAMLVRKNFEPLPLFVILSLISIFLFVYISNRKKSYPYQVAEDLILKEGGHETILSKRELLISDENIIVKGEFYESTYKWQAIKNKVDHKDCYYLYVGPRDAIIVPKRIFATPEEFYKFQDYLLKHLSLEADFPKSK